MGSLDSFSKSLAGGVGDQRPADRRGFLRKMLAVVAGGAALTAVGAVPAEAATVTCPPGMKACGKKCRDVYIDPDNCGACGNFCATNEVCRKGVCVAFGNGGVCAAGETDCSGTCADLSTSHDNCGACGTPCPGGATCAGGQCSCPTGEVVCPGAFACVDIANSHDNCGACGTVCGAGQICTSGVCTGSILCSVATDCPGVDTECSTRTCTGGVCGQSHAVYGTALASQTTGDCQKNVCDGTGGTTSIADDTDLPADGNICTQDVCSGGVPSHPPQPASFLCAPPNHYCNGAGTCL
jgi:hypothetical protein